MIAFIKKRFSGEKQELYLSIAYALKEHAIVFGEVLTFGEYVQAYMYE